MKPKYDHNKYEKEIYNLWEKSGAFTPKVDPKKKPYTIVLPPPNASGKMHIGNVLMIAIEDLLIRWKRMQGYAALWLPGTDHAGIETQTTYERELKKEGKSRFDFDRQTFYDIVWKYVQDNKGFILQQLREMGASVDWSRLKFTLDPDVVKTVYDTFEKMEKEGLIYRGDYLVNYSFKHGTTFSDAEIRYTERKDPLYFIKYKLLDRKDDEPEFLEVATVRPETIMADTHLAVNPNDSKNSKYDKRKVLNPLTDKPMQIISDTFVDPEFGTGIVKITPAHDKNDFEVGRKHNLPVLNIINWKGQLENVSDKYQGLNIDEARELAIEELEKKQLINKLRTQHDYIHQVPVDYRSGDYIENLILPNWFVKVDDKKQSLKKSAYKAVIEGKIKIYPKWREITYLRWMENLHDWAISRQNVWGIRIPIWYKVTKNTVDKIWVSWINKDKNQMHGPLSVFLNANPPESLEDIIKGLQRTIVSPEVPYIVSAEKPHDKNNYLPETDTFDTWFSSGQWPLVTLGYPDSPDFKYFYPTSVLETGWEIVTRWVSRMIMFGIYLTGKVPFNNIYLHGHVRAIDGRKMSKSLGNVINPEEYQEEFGTDALRMGLISGTANGKDFNFPRDKVIAYRNFANKIWNMARFMQIMFVKTEKEISFYSENLKNKLNKDDENILKDLDSTIQMVNHSLAKYRFADAAEAIYHFMWNRLASDYLEKTKDRDDKEISLSVLRHVYLSCLKLLHPFMPFITEVIWQELKDLRKYPDQLLISSSWPKTV
jgi:valyl-tRNA synthetase